MSRELSRITLRLDDRDELVLSRLMLARSIKEKSKLFYYLLHNWDNLQSELERVRSALSGEVAINRKLSSENKDIVGALKVLAKFSGK